ncbi:Maf family protein [Pseudoalteromonas sp. SSDWG2]|uniref:Maf family protein n=1 Tax=Pseudoalteromonas sp. SSDWG2 TaxID=3139391 RepID=UPI003BAAB6F5
MSAIYLASQSPRRRELLSQLGIEFVQFSVDADETPFENESARQLVERLARLKAETGVAMGYEDRPVLGSDTVVVYDNHIMGKPTDFEDFQRMMKQLSGRTHQVLTAIALSSTHKTMSKVVTTDVTFKPLSDDEITAYWHTQEPLDKAGGYGIQGRAGAFVTHLSGSYFAVMGLPLYETQELIAEFNNEL